MIKSRVLLEEGVSIEKMRLHRARLVTVVCLTLTKGRSTTCTLGLEPHAPVLYAPNIYIGFYECFIPRTCNWVTAVFSTSKNYLMEDRNKYIYIAYAIRTIFGQTCYTSC